MQIHELPAGTPAAGMTFAGDTGAQTQKIDYGALADAILNKLTTKNFDIKSESQTIIAALNSLGDASKQGVANNLVTTGAGYVLDARQGKALSDLHAANADAIAALNSRTVFRDVTVTTGSSLYDNRYYANFDIPSGLGDLVGLFIQGSGDNKAVYAIRVSAVMGRAYSHTASTSVTIRMLFMK